MAPLSGKLNRGHAIFPFDARVRAVLQKQLKAVDVTIRSADHMNWIFARNVWLVGIRAMGEEKFGAFKARPIHQSLMKEGGSVEARALGNNEWISSHDSLQGREVATVHSRFGNLNRGGRSLSARSAKDHRHAN